MTNDNDVSDEEVTPVRPKRKSKKSVSGDGDVPLVRNYESQKVMNKKEHDSLKVLIISLDPSIFYGVIADNCR